MITKKTAKQLMRLIQDYADASAIKYYADDQGTGNEPENATIEMNKAKLELLIKLDSLTGEE